MRDSYFHAYEVGKFYMVPCVLTTSNQVIGCGKWVPIIGPKHEDAEHINFPYPHWHVDWRFVPAVMLERARFHAFSGSEYARPVQEKDSNYYGLLVTSGPVMRRMKCKRQFAAYPHKQAPWMTKLEQAHKDCRMKNMVCPHRGLPLNGCQTDGDVVTCPGHGLRWNIKTGELVASPSVTHSPTKG